jgi:osmotically-inducible protein OsmY
VGEITRLPTTAGLTEESEVPVKKFIRLLPLLFVGLNVLFTGCDDRSRQSGSRTTPSSSTTPSTSKMSDSELEKAIRAELEKNAQLKEANLSVIAIAERNEVTLSGTVRSRAAREKAIELAKIAKPGVLVNDKIDVKPGG